VPALDRYAVIAHGCVALPGLLLISKIRAQAQDPYAAILAQRQHRPIARNDGVGPSGDRTFKDAVVRSIREHAQAPDGFDHRAEVAEEHGHAGQFFGVTRELAREHAEQFVQDRLGKQQCVVLFNDAPQRFLAAAARKYERGDEDVGVEDDLQARR